MRQLPIRPRLLLFYGGTIAAVLVLFRLTTAYGETRLEAPLNIDGIYLSPIAPPGCPPDSRLQITVQQSGIYLNGAVTLVSANAAPDAAQVSSEQLPLTGRWQQGEIVLSGRTRALTACQPQAQNPAIKLTGTIAPANRLTANLQFDSETPAWSFTADRQAKPAVEQH